MHVTRTTVVRKTLIVMLEINRLKSKMLQFKSKVKVFCHRCDMEIEGIEHVKKCGAHLFALFTEKYVWY